MKNLVRDLNLLPKRGGPTGEQAERVRDYVASMIDEETGDLPGNAQEIKEAVEKGTGIGVTSSAIGYHISQLRYVLRAMKSKQVPPDRPTGVSPDFQRKLRQYLNVAEPPAPAPATPPPAVTVAAGVLTINGDLHQAAMDLGNAISRFSVSVLARVQEQETLVTKMREDLTQEFANIEQRISTLFKPVALPEIGSVGASVLDAGKPTEATFAEHYHLPRTTVNEYRLFYPSTLDVSLKNFPEKLLQLLVDDIKRFSMNQNAQGLGVKVIGTTGNGRATHGHMAPLLQKYGRQDCKLLYFKITRRWIVLVNFSANERTYWIERVLNRGQTPGLTEA